MFSSDVESSSFPDNQPEAKLLHRQQYGVKYVVNLSPGCLLMDIDCEALMESCLMKLIRILLLFCKGTLTRNTRSEHSG